MSGGEESSSFINVNFSLLGLFNVNAWVFLILFYGLAIYTAYLTPSFTFVQQFFAGAKLTTFYSVLISDVLATIVVFIGSVLVGNSSVYDAYWSVAPPFLIYAYWGGVTPLDERQYLVAFLVVAWAVRLTGNWAYGWRGHEDWRYVLYREGEFLGFRPCPAILYWILFSFGGFHLFPTILVWAGTLPLQVVFDPEYASAGRPLNWLDAIATLITASGILICLVSDIQMWRYRARKSSASTTSGTLSTVPKFMDQGLWAYCRHPNYLGEIMFWIGATCFGCAAWDPSQAPSLAHIAFLASGSVGMIGLFVSTSAPLLDDKLRVRKGWKAYEARVPSSLLPVF